MTAKAQAQAAKPELLDPEEATNPGWNVTFAGLGINLALGILYTWSVISSRVPSVWDWNETAKSLPYSIACLVFCLTMVPAGRMQDKIGPRSVATLGGLLVGLGMVAASFGTSVAAYVIGFGVLAGAGIGFGYASATPPAVKWFHKTKTGLIAGLVVSGFGLASVYAAPLSAFLIDELGLPWTMRILGIAFLLVLVGILPVARFLYHVVVVGLANHLHTPPADYTAPKPVKKKAEPSTGGKDGNYTGKEMLTTWQFYVIWFMYACGAGAGLMIIAKLATIADKQAGIVLGSVLVATLAVGNGAGRIIAGVLSDKMGRTLTMFASFVMQAILIFLLAITKQDSFLANVVVLAVLSALIGANYGANLSLFPSITKDFYGLKNFGMNYGLVFTAWGVGGFALALAMGKVYDATKSFNYAYFTACGLLVLAAILTFVVRAPQYVEKAKAK